MDKLNIEIDMKKIILSIIVFVFIIQFSNAQEPFTHNLYTANPFLINPAATGYEKALTAFADVYSQWSTFPEAPRSYSFGINSPITDKAGLGLYVFDDKRDYLNHLNAMVDYSYRVKLNMNSDLTFGLGFGIVHNNVNFSNLIPSESDFSDPLYLDQSQYNKTQIAASAGLLYRYKALELQFSLPQMLEQGKNFASQYNLMGMYDYKSNSEFDLKPSILMRACPGNIMQFDGNVMAEYKKMFWVQLGYRTDESLLASIGLNWESFKLAYCYQVNMGPVKVLSTSTNEIMLAYIFPNKLFKSKTPTNDVHVITTTSV